MTVTFSSSLRLNDKMEKQTESAYIQRILSGEINIFSVFVEQHHRSVYALIRQMALSNEDAEELTQDVFLKAFEKLHSFKGDCSFSTWIYRIAYNTAVSYTRKKRLIFPSIDDAMIENIKEETVDAFFEEENQQKMEKLTVAMQKLNIEEKTLVALFYTDNKSIVEIGLISGLSTENVKVKLFRIRKKIFKLMTEQ